MFGGKSLLLQTAERIGPLFSEDRTQILVTRAHEKYYRGHANLIVQPENRGTAVAIALSLLRIVERDPSALVAFFPCDHYYANDEAFVRVVRGAMSCAGPQPDSVVLLGAEAHSPVVEYGWIESGAAIPNSPAVPLERVRRFWEKPSSRKARGLWRRGGLWNTFVTIGCAAAFLDLLRRRLPHVLDTLHAHDADTAYRTLHPADFSRDVLSPMAARLLVVRDTASGWTDLGNPNRVIETMVRNRIEPSWLIDAPNAECA